VLWVIYRWAQSPLVLIRPADEPRRTRSQKASDFPPPFPNGWFHVCRSECLATGQVKELQVLGKVLVLFRTKAGEAAILDAFCPHLGANLGCAGEVNENCLKCCFHGWEFTTEGECVKVDGTDTLPPKAQSALKKWPSKETNGGIFLWHDAEGRAPLWDLEPLDCINDGTYYSAGRTWGTVNAHVQELPENGPDVAHLNVLHRSHVVEFVSSIGHHEWWAQWRPHEEHEHLSTIELTQDMRFFGVKLPFLGVKVYINQMGPGIVRLRIKSAIGEAIVYELVTPHRTTTQIVEHAAYCSPTLPRFVGKAMLWALEAQFQRDRPIWQTKKYLPRPVISKADGPIMQFRRWFQQFYSESSTSFPDALAAESMMDW
jgi:cholesterol 7-dehydrogenase